jgi:hypothetical protein
MSDSQDAYGIVTEVFHIIVLTHNFICLDINVKASHVLDNGQECCIVLRAYLVF